MSLSYIIMQIIFMRDQCATKQDFQSLIKMLFFFISMLFFSNSCASYKIPTSDFHAVYPCGPSDSRTLASLPNQAEALDHPLYQTIPRHRCQIRWFDLGHWSTWTLFGNDDDGIFGEEPTANYRLEERPDYKKAFLWWCRNPLHNFCFYVIGSAERTNSEITFFSEAF